jgi:hypothetical protein
MYSGVSVALGGVLCQTGILSCRCPALLELSTTSVPPETQRRTSFTVTLGEGAQALEPINAVCGVCLGGEQSTADHNVRADVKADEFRELLRFVYTGEVKISSTDREACDGLQALAERWSPQLAAHLTSALTRTTRPPIFRSSNGL